MKKLFSLVLAVCVLAAPMAASAQPEIQINIGEYIQMGKYNDEPILWRCIDVDENGPLLFSDRILCRKAYDLRGVNASGSHVRRGRIYDNYWGDRYWEHAKLRFGYSNYWGDSNIRCWLNSAMPAGKVEWLCGNPPNEENADPVAVNPSFYDQEKGFLADGNFTQEERNLIKTVKLRSLLAECDAELATSGSAEAWEKIFNLYMTYSPGDNNYDDILAEELEERVFLLDIEQFWDLYQKSDVLGEYYDSSFEVEGIVYKDYALRSPMDTLAMVPTRRQQGAVMFATGRLGYGAEIHYKPAERTFGIRPAFYLDEENAQILSGSGTEEDPYIIGEKKKDGICVCLNGWELEFDVPPMLENDRTLVPMRAIFEALGAEVSWYPEDRTIVAVRGDTTVFMQVDDWYMAVNDEWIALDAPPRIVNDRTLIPLRAVAEAFGAQVGWDEATQTVTVELY